MAGDGESAREAEIARERIAEILRGALASGDAELEDETRRLMLHLAIEPYEETSRPLARVAPQPVERRSLFRRILRRQ